MRVLMVSKLWPPRAVGGAERYAAGLADHLVEAGHDVGVVTFGVGGDLVVAQVPTRGVDPERWWASSTFVRRRSHVLDLWNPDTRRVLRDAVGHFRPDVVHSHAVAAMSVAALLADAPRVHTVHDHWLLCWRGYPIRDGVVCETTCAGCVPYARSRHHLLRRRPPRFIAPSDAVRRAHADKGWDTSAWHVVPHPVEAPPVGSAPAVPTAREGLRVGFIGQMTREKGIDLVLAAVPEVDPGAEIIVAGSGALDDVVRAHPLVDHRGVVGGAAKEAFFSDIDVLVVPSRVPEIAGLVIDEATVRGVPVIASRRGGIPEYVPAPCAPLLFDPDRPGDLAAALGRFVAQPAVYAVRPPAGRSWDEHVQRILAVYEEATAEPVT